MAARAARQAQLPAIEGTVVTPPGPSPVLPPVKISKTARKCLMIISASLFSGIYFMFAGAEENSPDLGSQAPGAPLLWIGGVLIIVPLLAAAVSAVVRGISATAQEGREMDARAGVPPAPKNNPLAWVLSLAGCIAVFLIGVLVIVTQSGQGGSAGKSATDFGVFLIAAGLLSGAAWLAIGILTMTRGHRAAYRRWMASLTPQQRMAVHMAQAAGLVAAHETMKHSSGRARERREGQAARHQYVKDVVRHAQGLGPPPGPRPPGMPVQF
jgi:hypothetical protein